MTASWRNPAWKYRRSESTNIRLTFARERKKLDEQKRRDAEILREREEKAVPLPTRRSAA